MDDSNILDIYNSLTRKRKEVINRMLAGQNKTQIALAVCNGSEGAVSNLYTQIYKKFDKYLTNSDPQSQRASLISIFNIRAQNLVSRLRVEYNYNFYDKHDPEQFEPLLTALDEYCFSLTKVSTEEIPALQARGRRFFNPKDYLATPLLQSWCEKDPNSFRKIVTKQDLLIGFFIVLFIEKETLDRFSDGIITEHELDGSTIIAHTDQEPNYDDRLYVSVVVVDSSSPHINTIVFLILAKYIDCIRNSRTVNKILANGATNSENRLLRKMGFKLLCAGERRKDNENFYEMDINALVYPDSLYHSLLDCSPVFKRYRYQIDMLNEEASWYPRYGNLQQTPLIQQNRQNRA